MPHRVMKDRISLVQLRQRWEAAQVATDKAVSAQPSLYGELKLTARAVVDQSLDIGAYFPAAEKLDRLVRAMDPGGSGSIFEYFSDRFSPKTIWQVRLLRMECRDLLCHLEAFDQWRRDSRQLRVVK